MRKYVLSAALCLVCLPVSAGNLVYQCEFTSYASPKGIKRVSEEFRLVFMIDTVTGDAVIVGNNGHAQVKPVFGSEGLTFLEHLDTGVVQTTTISKLGPAVHSRHTIIAREVVPSQYYGVCK